MTKSNQTNKQMNYLDSRTPRERQLLKKKLLNKEISYPDYEKQLTLWRKTEREFEKTFGEKSDLSEVALKEFPQDDLVSKSSEQV